MYVVGIQGDTLFFLLQGPSLEWCSLVPLVAPPFKPPPPSSTWKNRLHLKGCLSQRWIKLWVSHEAIELISGGSQAKKLLSGPEGFQWLRCPQNGSSLRRLIHGPVGAASPAHKRQICPLLPSILWFLCVIRSLFFFLFCYFFVQLYDYIHFYYRSVFLSF